MFSFNFILYAPAKKDFRAGIDADETEKVNPSFVIFEFMLFEFAGSIRHFV